MSVQTHSGNRRSFLKTAAAGITAAAMTGPASSRVLGANNRINLGVIGTGGRGTAILGELVDRSNKEGDCQVLAVCDLYEKRVRRAKGICGGDGYRYYQEILDRPDIDAVFIATPDHWHAKTAIDSMEAEKDVYLEKPMTRTAEEAKKVWEVWKKTGRVVQVGAQGSSHDQWWQARMVISSGMIGKPVWAQASAARNSGTRGEWNWGIDADASPDAPGEANVDWKTWLGTAPRKPWDPDRFFRFRKFWDYSGGIATDLLYHDLAPLNIALSPQFPWRVVGMGGIWVQHDTREVADTFFMNVDYAQEYSINLPSSMANDVGVDNIIRCLKGTIFFEKDHLEVVGNGPYKEEFKKQYGSEKVNIPYENRPDHTTNFLDCVRSREKPHLDCETAFKVMVAIAMSVESYRQSKVLYYDDRRLRVTTRPIQLASQLPRDSSPA
ncbi:MAG: Gfo/Idh/MocA family oxidoreductase [bacterium]